MFEEENNCLICGEENVSNHHYRSIHKMTMAEYFEEYHPRFDMLTNEKIDFTTKDKYFVTDFVDKRNMKKWMSEQRTVDVENYVRKKIQERIDRKNIKFIPSEIELYTCSSLPSRKYIDKYCDFDQVCNDLGLTQRFKSHDEEIISDTYYKDNEKHWINIDPREQKPFKLKYPTQIKKLDFGDYALNTPTKCGNIFIERKSLVDLVCTLSGNYERFINEIIRAKKKKSYLIVLVEEGVNKLLIFNKLPQFRNTKIKATPDFICYRLRSIMEEYDNINFVFCDGRKDSVATLYKILFSNGICREVDVQLMKSQKLI